MQSSTLEIVVRSETASDANRLTADLQSYLSQLSELVNVSRVKENQETQDLGATLLAVLATPAVTAIAKGIADWLRKHQTAKVTLKSDGGIILENVNPARAEEFIRTHYSNKK